MSVLMSFYGIFAFSPALAVADSGGSNGSKNKDKQEIKREIKSEKKEKKSNHGAAVSAVARSHSEDEGENHGSTVREVARDNYGHRDDDDDDEDGDDNGGQQNQAFQISNINAVPGETSSSINWITNKPTSGTVLFGTSPWLLTNSVSENPSQFSLSHQLNLTGLTPNTLYYYVIKAKNASSTEITSSIRSFRTSASTLALAISNVTASSTGTTSEAIIWDTNKSANSKVYYSTTSPVVIGGPNTQVASSGTLLTHHQINLANLISGQTYYFLVVSTDSSSTTATSSQQSFVVQTQAPSDTTPPNILFASNNGLSTSTTSLIWITNESSDSKVWISTTTPVATTTAPVASSGTLSFFHQLGIPNLATSTLYYYTVSSTDSSGNTGYYSNSFTTPAI